MGKMKSQITVLTLKIVLESRITMNVRGFVNWLILKAKCGIEGVL